MTHLHRPRRTSWHNEDVDRKARHRWLGTQLCSWRNPETPPPTADRDGHSDLGFALCACGAEEHESCRCVTGWAA